MPKIPLYEQGRLASSLVGTPGVDNSGQVMAETVASGLSQLNTALAYKQRQTLAAQKELETLQRNAMAGERVSAISLKKTMIANDLKAKHMYDPDVGEVELNKQLAKLLEDETAGIQDPMLKAMVTGKGREEIVAEQKSYSDFKLSRAVPIMEKSLEAQSGDLSFRVRSAVDPETGAVDPMAVGKLFEDFDNRTSGVMANLYGPAAGERNRQAKGEALKGMLFEMAAKGPNGTQDDEKFADYLKTVYETPQFNMFMDPADGKQVLVEARRIAAEASRAKKEEKVTVERETTQTVQQEINALIESGNQTPEKMFALAKTPGISQATANSLTNLGNRLRKETTTKGKAITVDTLKVDTVNAINKADIAYTKFTSRYDFGTGAMPSKPYSKDELTQQYIDHSETLQSLYAARSAFKANSQRINAAGTPYPKENPELEKKIARLEAESSGVVSGTMLVQRKQQFSQFVKSTPVPRFSNNPAEQEQKAYLYKRERDLYFAKVGQKYKGDIKAMEAALFGQTPSGQSRAKLIQSALFNKVKGF